MGRCVNGTEAAHMRVEAGNRPILDADIELADKLIIEGLSMLEGWLGLVRVCVSHSDRATCVDRLHTYRSRAAVCTRLRTLRGRCKKVWCSRLVHAHVI